LGENLDRQVISYIKEAYDKKAIVTSAVTIASGEAIVTKVNTWLLKEHGGPIDLTSVWTKSLHQQINFVKRKAITSAKVEPAYFEELKEQFLLDVEAVVDMEDIPSHLILNWGPHWNQCGARLTVDHGGSKGSKRVEAVGVSNKLQITAVLCVALSGELLPLQLIYQGKTLTCLPRFVSQIRPLHPTIGLTSRK